MNQSGFLGDNSFLGEGQRSTLMDRQGGSKSLMGITNSRNDVEEVYRFWGEKARYRLCQWRRGTSCVEPKA